MGAVLLPIYILIFVGLIYFIGIRPQQRRRREQQSLMSRLKPGDEVVTVGGLYGTVTEIEDGGTVLLEVAEDVDVRIATSAIVRFAKGRERRCVDVRRDRRRLVGLCYSRRWKSASWCEVDGLVAGAAAAGPAAQDGLQEQHRLRECQAGRGAVGHSRSEREEGVRAGDERAVVVEAAVAAAFVVVEPELALELAVVELDRPAQPGEPGEPLGRGVGRAGWRASSRSGRPRPRGPFDDQPLLARRPGGRAGIGWAATTRTKAKRPARASTAGRGAAGERLRSASAGSRSASAPTDSGLRSGRATRGGRPRPGRRSGTAKVVSGPKTPTWSGRRRARTRSPLVQARRGTRRRRRRRSRRGPARAGSPSRRACSHERAGELRLGLKDDLVGDLRLAPPLGRSAHHSSGRYSAQPSGSVPRSADRVHRDRDLAVADLAQRARVLALHPGECRPSLGIPVSSTTHAATPISGATRSAQARTSTAGSQGESARNCCIDS